MRASQSELPRPPGGSSCIWTSATTPLSVRRLNSSKLGARRVVKPTNVLHTRGFGKPQICAKRRARVIDAIITFASALTIVDRLIAEARA